MPKVTWTALLFTFMGCKNLYSGPSETKIVGGGFAKVGEFLSTVKIEQCSGTKVGVYTYLTAAHCITDSVGIESRYKKYQPIRISHGLNKRSFRHFQTTIYSSSVPVHYKNVSDSTGNTYDVALITVEDAFAEIPEATVDFDPVNSGEVVIFNGFGCEGNESLTEEIPQNLKYAESTVRELSADFIFLNEAQDNFKGCPGDSGGPLYRGNSRTPQKVIGVVSGGKSLGTGFTRFHNPAKPEIAEFLKAGLDIKPLNGNLLKDLPSEKKGCRIGKTQLDQFHTAIELDIQEFMFRKGPDGTTVGLPSSVTLVGKVWSNVDSKKEKTSMSYISNGTYLAVLKIDKRDLTILYNSSSNSLIAGVSENSVLLSEKDIPCSGYTAAK